jgi:hypothetical protein
MAAAAPADARRGCALIARHVATVAFPWDTTRALELALFRMFASPRIGGLLHRTGEFEARTQKRYDDTDLIVSEILENGYASERGRRAIARMNALHARFRIANEDFLYVLSTFVFEPIRWNARFGWRRMTPLERLGWFWREVGERMHIQDLPESDADFERFSSRYEREIFALRRQTSGWRSRHAKCSPAGFHDHCDRWFAVRSMVCSMSSCSPRSAWRLHHRGLRGSRGARCVRVR